MKTTNSRTVVKLVMAMLVLVYVFAIYNLFASGWANNATTTSLLFVGLLIFVAGLVLWNMVAAFVNSQKDTKK